jgi:hypothetical protein
MNPMNLPTSMFAPPRGSASFGSTRLRLAVTAVFLGMSFVQSNDWFMNIDIF